MDASNFTFENPEERPAMVVLPEGTPFPFSILEVNEMERSRGGNDMIPLKLEFDGGALGKTKVYEYLVFADNMKWKINQFLACVAGDAIKEGKKVNFNDPAFIQWLQRRTGKATLRIEPVKGKTYDRNVIDSYIYEGSSKGTGGAATARQSPPPEYQPADQDGDIDEEELPF
jgi:hypothetical protein